jgi:hypothetical protein
MDLTNKRPVVICTAVGGWYPAGLDRLQRSLIFNGTAADFLFWKNEYPPHSPSHQENPYAFKVAGFREAIRQGYKIMLHLDASFWAIQNPDSLFDIINDKGVFAFRSGYNCAQTCTDALLAATGYTRDEAEGLPEIATGAVGINIDNPDGNAVFETWAAYCDAGLFINNRAHDLNDSADPRFLHARQDQSGFSIAVHKNNVHFDYQDYVAYYNAGNPGYNPDKCLFFIGGL